MPYMYYTEYTEFKKTYGIPYKQNSENTLVNTAIMLVFVFLKLLHKKKNFNVRR